MFKARFKHKGRVAGLLAKFIFLSVGVTTLGILYQSYGLQSLKPKYYHGIFVSPEAERLLSARSTGHHPTIVPSSRETTKVREAIWTSPRLSTTEDPSLNRTRGYLVAANYDQQLQAALTGYFHLAKLTSLLNLSAVEPFVIGTNLVGLPTTREEVMELGDLYDLDHLKATMKSYKVVNKLVSFNTFAEKASRHVILMCFLTDLKEFQTYFSGKNRESRIIEVESNSIQFVTYTLLRILNWRVSMELSGHSRRFISSRIVFIDVRPYHPLPLSVITGKLDAIISEEVEKYGSATVVIERWRGIHNVNGSKFFYFVPGFSAVDAAVQSKRRLQFSTAVVSAARMFTQTLSPARPVIGVHIRGERLLLDSKGNVSLYVHCLEELKRVISEGPIRATPEQVCLFHDLGPYGTMSCTLQHCVDGRTRFVRKVKKLGYRIVSFDPIAFGGVPRSPAFVSLVEMEYLSHVDILVTVGRGGYQQAVVDRFLSNSGGRTERVHRICHQRVITFQ